MQQLILILIGIAGILYSLYVLVKWLTVRPREWITITWMVLCLLFYIALLVFAIIWPTQEIAIALYEHFR